MDMTVFVHSDGFVEVDKHASGAIALRLAKIEAGAPDVVLFFRNTAATLAWLEKALNGLASL